MGLYGKHPAKGDFIEAGLPAVLLPLIESWLDGALGEVREILGSEWQSTWARAPVVRFWIGEGVWGGPLAGVMAASKDRVGRRFPLLMLVAGADAPAPPVCDPQQIWYDQATSHLLACFGRSEFAAPAELLAGAPYPTDPAGVTGVTMPEFWAVQPGPEPARLWQDVTSTDHRHAAAGRTYWWVSGEPVDTVAEPKDFEPNDIGPESTLAAGDQPYEDAVEPAKAEPTLIEATADLAPAGEDAERSAWDLPPLGDLDDDMGSPFDGPGAGLGLFAAPEAAIETDPSEVAQVAAPFQDASGPVMRAPLWSQVWAGNGLPSGAVLAWFFRGHVGNG